jgi:hypothetical protein
MTTTTEYKKEYVNRAVLFDLVARSLGHNQVIKALTGLPIAFVHDHQQRSSTSHGNHENLSNHESLHDSHGDHGNRQWDQWNQRNQSNHGSHAGNHYDAYRVYFRANSNPIGDLHAGHFFAIDDRTGHTVDPYDADWQVAGSNGMCQTFSIMTCLGKTRDLRPGEYLNNAKTALLFAANHTLYFVRVWRKYALNSCYEEPYLDASELREDILALIESPDLADIFSREETFLYSESLE